jgi:hypothetical protein
MLSIRSLITKLSSDYPDLNFIASEGFSWSASTATIHYDASSIHVEDLIHEVAHAALKHQNYERDIQLIEMERCAWEFALDTLGPQYNIGISEDYIQKSLDTYRDWLHSRSTCPDCQATGIQTEKNNYRCVACGQWWRVNDGRVCALRRYTQIKKARS